MSAYVIILLAYAQVAAALTGFIGVVFIFAELSHPIRTGGSSALSHMIATSLGALFMSLFAAVLLVYFAAHEHVAWRVSNLISGVMHCWGGGQLAWTSWQKQTDFWQSRIVSSIGLGAGVVSLIAAGGYLIREEALIFMLATLWILGVTALAFVSLLVSSRTQATSQTVALRSHG